MPPSTVLVVDDHADSRMICEIILTRQGYRVLSAPDGASALELARSQPPDAIILDVALPRMDGWAVLEELKREPATTAIPVVLYTAHSADSDRARARHLGCAGYLVKPCSSQAIVDEVRRCIPPLTDPGGTQPVPAPI